MLSRRAFLAWGTAALGGMGHTWPAARATAQQARRPLRTEEAVSQVLNRLAFGPRPGQLAEIAKLGWQRWVDQQLHPDTLDDSAAAKRVQEACPSLNLSLSELQELGRKERGRIKQDLCESVLLRAVYSKRQFQEVMCEFWRNHFNVDVNKVPFLATHYEENVLRKHLFGRFEDFLLATARHPAMLVYLDNYVSHRNGVNENYARELMELHTLGVDNYYRQEDVVALARVLTGWTCGWRNNGQGEKEYQFFFNPGMHDTQPAAVVGLELDGKGGQEDGEKAIRHLAHHQGTARFIALKLSRYLIHDSPPAELVDRVAEAFQRYRGDLREVYRTLILSPEFLSANHYRTKFKTPFEFTVSVLRTTAAEITSTDRVLRGLALMGQPIYECVEPTGYSDLQEAWLDPGVMVYRWNFAIQIVTDKADGVRIGGDFAQEFMKAAPAARPRKVMQLVLPGVSDPRTERLLVHTSDPRAMVAYALGSPSFQQH